METQTTALAGFDPVPEHLAPLVPIADGAAAKAAEAKAFLEVFNALSEAEQDAKAPEAKALRLAVRKFRTEAEKVKKTGKENLLILTKQWDAAYNEIAQKCESIEADLFAAESLAERREAEKREAKRIEREAEIRPLVAGTPNEAAFWAQWPNLGDVPDAVWGAFVAERRDLKELHEARVAKEAAAEAARIEAERIEAEKAKQARAVGEARLKRYAPVMQYVLECDMSVDELAAMTETAWAELIGRAEAGKAEADKVAAEKAAQEKAKREVAERAAKEAETARKKAEAEALEAKRQQQEAAEKLAKEQAKQAAKEAAKEAAERAAKAEAERLEREAAEKLRQGSDKEKLAAFASALVAFMVSDVARLELQSEAGKEAHEKALGFIRKAHGVLTGKE